MTQNKDHVIVRRETDFMLVTFQSDLDMDIMIDVKPLLQRAIKNLDRAVLVDMSAVEFLDSAAVSLLAFFFQTAQAAKQTMMIIGTKDQPAAVLEMVGLADYVRLLPDLGAAIAALKAAA